MFAEANVMMIMDNELYVVCAQNLPGKSGDYKLCYQSPQGSDSVEQKASDGVVKIQAKPGDPPRAALTFANFASDF